MGSCGSDIGSGHTRQREEQRGFNREIASAEMQDGPNQARQADDHERHADGSLRRDARHINKDGCRDNRTAAAKRTQHDSDQCCQGHRPKVAIRHDTV